MSETPATPTVLDVGQDLEAALVAATEAVRAGQCVVLPTDTVYGIGADAFSAAAVQALLDAKGRGRDMPPPVLVAEPSMLRALTADVPPAAADLAKRFWPGPLTLVLKVQKALHLDLGETAGTVAVRVPDHDVARALLRRTGPLAVSSANVSGSPAAVTAPGAADQLGTSVAVYLDAGEAPGQVASTIVDFSRTTRGKVLRLGALGIDELHEVAPDVEGPDTEGPDA